MNGGGQVTLSASNNYTGGTTVNAGTLQLANASGLGSTSGSLAVNGGVLDIHGKTRRSAPSFSPPAASSTTAAPPR